MRPIKVAFLGAIVTAFTAASGAMAADPLPPGDDGFTVYGEHQGWTILVDVERGSCLIQSTDKDGNVVQMGLTKNQKHAYIGVFTKAEVDPPTRQKVEILVDGILFEGKAHGLKAHKLEGGYSGGYILVNNENMITAVQEGREMVVFPKKSFNFIIDLTGTKGAIDEARKCNLAQSA